MELKKIFELLTILHSEWPKLYGVLAIQSAIGSEWPKLYEVLAILSAIGLNKHLSLIALLLFPLCIKRNVLLN